MKDKEQVRESIAKDLLDADPELELPPSSTMAWFAERELRLLQLLEEVWDQWKSPAYVEIRSPIPSDKDLEQIQAYARKVQDLDRRIKEKLGEVD